MTATGTPLREMVEAVCDALWRVDNPTPDAPTWAEWIAYVEKHPFRLEETVAQYRRRAEAVVAGPLAAQVAALTAENRGLKAAYGCHVQADAYRDTMPDDEADAKALRRSETYWRLMARAVIATDDPLTDTCGEAAKQIPQVVAEVESAIDAVMNRGATP